MRTYFVRSAGGLRWPAALCVLLSPLFCSSLLAKTPGLAVIEIYSANGHQAYEQISDFLLTGKNEVSLCGDASSFDKNTYHKLAKVQLAAGMSLERDSKGVLMLTQATGSACVVPANLKFDKGGSSTPADLAGKAEMVGTVLPASDPVATQIAPLDPGVKLVFVAAPDREFAEYLRADRQDDIPGWQLYLNNYTAGAHLLAARKALAALYVDIASTDRQAYENSKSGIEPDYSKLADAHQMVGQAQVLVPDDPATTLLASKIHAEVITLSRVSIEKLNLYTQALNQHTAGYANLVAAEKLADGAVSVEPATSEGASAQQQTAAARASFDKTLHDVEMQIVERHADQAAQTIDPLRPFAQENVKIAQDIDAIAALYLAQAKDLEEVPDWPGAVSDLEKASAIVPSPETTALLKDAKVQAKIFADKSVAAAATQKSQDSESRGDILAAYEVLDDLPPDPRALVTERLDSLKEQYIQAAEQAAASLQKAHEPINGISDEIGIQAAYGYLLRCYRLTSDPGLQDHIAILGGDLSNYYLQQGKRYVEKPAGTGVNVGWTYLSEALQYKSSDNLGAIHDEMTTARASYLLKSRLSVIVVFRDQTSRRDAGNFPAQLTDALATGLESSGLDVKVVRQQDTPPVPPNFQLVGDVLQHEMLKSQDNIPKQSEYRFGQQEIPNEAWAQASRDYEHANNELESARSVLQGAQARGKKNEIKDAQKVVDDDQKAVEDLHEKLDMVPKTKLQDEERPYTYTQVVYHLRIALEVQFQILDSAGEDAVERISLKRETPRDYSTLENVKPEDTQGIQNVGVIPNDNDYFEEDENKTRDELIEKAKATVAQLPQLVISRADRKAADGDNDGAAELYILYLNATPTADTPERTKARKFLAAQFNFNDVGRDESSQ
jgi:hypothetical protein